MDRHLTILNYMRGNQIFSVSGPVLFKSYMLLFSPCKFKKLTPAYWLLQISWSNCIPVYDALEKWKEGMDCSMCKVHGRGERYVG